jgi:hypothetical protein
MSIAITAGDWGYGTASSTAVTGGAGDTAAAGDTMEVAIFYTRASGTSISSITDTQGNTYTINGSLVDDGSILKGAVYKAVNCAGGGTNTITCTMSGSTTNIFIGIARINGASTSPYDTSTGQYQATPGTGANGVTSGTSATLATQPALVTVWTQPNTMNTSIAAGTGFTSYQTGDGLYGSTSKFMLEYQRVTATTALAGTFTAGANVGHLTILSVYKEATSGTTPITRRRSMTGNMRDLTGGF